VYVQTYKRNTEARSCNNYCSGKAVGITYSECVFVAFVIHRAKHMRQPRRTVFFHIIS